MGLWSKFLALMRLAPDTPNIEGLELVDIVAVAESECLKKRITPRQLESYDAKGLDTLVGGFPPGFGIQRINKVQKYTAQRLYERNLDDVRLQAQSWLAGQGWDNKYLVTIEDKPPEVAALEEPYGRSNS